MLGLFAPLRTSELNRLCLNTANPLGIAQDGLSPNYAPSPASSSPIPLPGRGGVIRRPTTATASFRERDRAPDMAFDPALREHAEHRCPVPVLWRGFGTQGFPPGAAARL